MAVAVLLTVTQVWSFGALLKFFILPLLVMHATLSTTSKEVEGAAKKERKSPSMTMRKSPSMTSLELLFPELESTASQVSDLLVEAQQADQSSVFRRQVSGDPEDEEDWQFGVALHQIPMYQLQRLSKNLSKELQRARSGTFGSNTDLVQSGSEENLKKLREASKAKSRKERSTKKTPLDKILNIIGWPARYLFREMWLWTERDLALYAVVGLFLLEVYVAWTHGAGHRFWRRVNIPVSIQVLVCHNMTTYLLIVLAFSPGQRDLYVGKVPCWQTYVWAFLLLVLSIIGMIGTNLVWACGSVRLSLKRKVFLMICQSIANQGSIFRWSRDQRCHLKNKGTDADPYDPNRGALYRYIGWFLMHKTPKMIEATRSVDVSDLLQDQVVMFQADVDSWWNLSLGHAIPAFVTLLWGEELFLGWVIAGCFRSVLALHINLTLLRFQHLWAPQTVTFTGADSSEEEEETTTSGRTSQQAEQTRRMGAAHQPAILRSASIADAQKLMEESSKEAARALSHLWSSQKAPPPKQMTAEVNESGGGDPSLEVRLEPLWRRSTLVDLAKVARRLKIELPPTLLFDHPTINVMVSTSCHLPGGANSLKDYWNLLAEKRDAVVQVPLARWDHELYYSKEPQKGKTYARHGGFVEGTDLFDVTYFNLGTAEAKTTDPQQRLLLTAAYDALRGDGYDKALLQNNPLGVFTALSNMDWYQLVVPEAGVYTGPGVSSAIAANRISYVFGLKGPSMTVTVFASLDSHNFFARSVEHLTLGPLASLQSLDRPRPAVVAQIDTACSSSLSALHAALRSLEARKNVSAPVHRGALLNAAEVLHGPSSFVLRSVAGMLSPDGRCKTFDATADGYIRGEGAGAILLKPAESAEEGRCLRIAEVRAVVMNQDGKSATLTAPNGPSQEELLVMALREAHVAASALNALECHGTGTALGDPIEVGAIKAAVGRAEGGSPPLYLAAGKSNHGHLEGAAGFAGLMKVAACLQRHEVPPNIHFQELNPHINLTSSRLEMPLEVRELKSDQAPAMGVSSFGFGGTNTHACQGSQLPEMGVKLYKCDENFKAALDRCAQILEGHPLLEPTGDRARLRAVGQGQVDTVTPQDLRDILFANGPEAALRYDQLGGSEDSEGVAYEMQEWAPTTKGTE
eukprot:s1029_g13.t1